MKDQMVLDCTTDTVNVSMILQNLGHRPQQTFLNDQSYLPVSHTPYSGERQCPDVSISSLNRSVK